MILKLQHLIIFLLTIITFNPAYGQKQIKFKIHLTVGILESSLLKPYEDQFTNVLLNELDKISDVRQVESGYSHVLYISFFDIPCKCPDVDFYYRVHFYKNADGLPREGLPNTEGFRSVAEFERLAKEIVAYLNSHQLRKLRE